MLVNYLKTCGTLTHLNRNILRKRYLVMKSITLKRALLLYVDAVLENNTVPSLYLKDGDNHYHEVDEIDLNDARMRCNDGYWDYYEYIMETEDSGENQKLFIKEN